MESSKPCQPACYSRGLCTFLSLTVFMLLNSDFLLVRLTVFSFIPTCYMMLILMTLFTFSNYKITSHSADRIEMLLHLNPHLFPLCRSRFLLHLFSFHPGWTHRQSVKHLTTTKTLHPAGNVFWLQCSMVFYILFGPNLNVSFNKLFFFFFN